MTTAQAEPSTPDESVLAGLLFERVTKMYPEWNMGDRTDLAMAMFVVFKKWAHNLDLTSESHEIVEFNEEGEDPVGE